MYQDFLDIEYSRDMGLVTFFLGTKYGPSY